MENVWFQMTLGHNRFQSQPIQFSGASCLSSFTASLLTMLTSRADRHTTGIQEVLNIVHHDLKPAIYVVYSTKGLQSIINEGICRQTTIYEPSKWLSDHGLTYLKEQLIPDKHDGGSVENRHKPLTDPLPEKDSWVSDG